MEIYLKLFEVLFPVFFVVGIGYYLGKNNPKLDTSFITYFCSKYWYSSNDNIFFNINWNVF